MMRAIAPLALALWLCACGSDDVESETAETLAAQRDAADSGEEQDEPADRGEEIEIDEATGDMVRDDPPANSVYTSLDECERTETFEESSGFAERCEGPEPWTLTYRRSDGRENLVLLDEAGEEHPIEAATIIGKGAFSELGRTLEWRSAEGETQPRALIFRMDVARPDPMEADRSSLGVVRLDGPICLIGTVPPGPGQNVVARKLADRDRFPACLGEDGSD